MGSNQAVVETTVLVQVLALSTDPVTGLPVVLLQDDIGRTIVPVSIGLSEASALAAEIDGIELSRPATHQLTALVLERCGAELVRAVITGVDGGLFCAAVHLRLGCGSLCVQEARPSDAIALALHVGAELCVAPSVLEQGTCADAPVELAADGVAEFADGAIDITGNAIELVEEPVEFADAWTCGAVGDDELLVGLGEDAFGKWKM